MFGFYEILLCVVLLMSRFDVFFGILDKQQYFELAVISFCFLMISWFDFDIDVVARCKDNFHAKALLSFANQIYLMQRNVNSTILGQRIVFTPLLQSFLCWTFAKIIIKKTLN